MLNPDDFLSVVAKTPLVSIDLVLVRPDGSTLLGQRNNRPAQGYWFVPGGRINKDESLAGALQRISLRELGVDLSVFPQRWLGVYEHFYPDNFAGVEGVSTHYVVLAHRIEVPADFVCMPADDQHAALEWWGVADLLSSAKVHPNTQAYFQGVE